MTRDSSPYRTIPAGAAAWRDARARGRLRLEGRDASAFLHALVSNDVAALREGDGVYAAYLTPQGRMIADLRIYHRGGHLLVGTPAGLAAGLAARLDQAIFSEDVRVTDVSTELSQAIVVGEPSSEAISRALGFERSALDRLPVWSQLSAGGVIAARSDETEEPTFDLFVAAERFDDMTRALVGAGAVALSAEALEALRIEAGRPEFGRDMTEDTIPLEAGLLDRAISTAKGCYVGQEIIVRVLHRGGGRVARRLVRIDLAENVEGVPAAGDAILADGNEVGRVTSAAWSPRLERGVVLGFVQRAVAEGGRRVSVRMASGETPAVPGVIVRLAG